MKFNAAFSKSQNPRDARTLCVKIAIFWLPSYVLFVKRWPLDQSKCQVAMLPHQRRNQMIPTLVRLVSYALHNRDYLLGYASADARMCANIAFRCASALRKSAYTVVTEGRYTVLFSHMIRLYGLKSFLKEHSHFRCTICVLHYL